MLKTDIGGHLSKLPAAADEHDASTLSSTLSSLSARVVSGCGAVRGQKRSLYPPDPTMESPGKTSIWDGEMGEKFFPPKKGGDGGNGARSGVEQFYRRPNQEGGGCWLEESWKKTKLITRRRRKVDSAPLYPPEGKKEKFKLSRAYCTYPVVGIKRREEPALFP